MATCPRCQQEIRNAPTVEFLGLSVSLVSGVIGWRSGEELLPLRPKPKELLYQIMLGGSRGAKVPSLIALVGGAGSSVSVHMTALRHWLNDNCLPLKVVHHERAFILMDAQ